MRSIPVAYLLWLFFGVLGVHRFYCGKIGTGILWFFTGGVFLIGWLVDVVLIPAMVEEANREAAFCRPYAGHVFGGQRFPNTAGPGMPPQAASIPNQGGRAAAPNHHAIEGLREGYRVVFCTRCGSSMQVPSNSAGASYACPNCRIVLQVPA